MASMSDSAAHGGTGRTNRFDQVPPVTAHGRRRLGVEILLVLGLSLGASAIYSLVSLLNRITLPQKLSAQMPPSTAPSAPVRFST